VSCNDPENAASNLVDLQDMDSTFISDICGNNWICYDFHTRMIIPSYYAVCSGGGQSHPKSWIVETSEDGEHWSEIDRKQNNDELNRPRSTKVFAVSKAQHARYIRLANIGPNHCGDDQLVIAAWEIFGDLLERMDGSD
jgi:hypothetical protein